MSRQNVAIREKYRQELGRQFARKHHKVVFKAWEELAGCPDTEFIVYRAISEVLTPEITTMTDETLGHIVATNPEHWGRRTLAFLKIDYPLEKPGAELGSGREFLETLARCAIFAAMMDYYSES